MIIRGLHCIIFDINLVGVEVRLTIGMEIQNDPRHLITSLINSQLLTGNKSEENIEFLKKKLKELTKTSPGHDLTKVFTKKS